MNKLFIGILTSSKIQMLKAVVQSVQNQQLYKTPYDIFIIVNTTDLNYFLLVKSTFPTMKIIKTESNGKPGKGHNSVLRVFKNNPEYDYLFILDGDDFLLPYAINQIEKIVAKYKCDCLHLYTNAVGRIEQINKRETHLNGIYNISYKTSFALKASIQDKISKLRLSHKSPFDVGIENVGTPTRMILLNKKGLKFLETFDYIYDEEMKIYDDFHPFLIGAKENCTGNKNCKVVFINNLDIYLYMEYPFSVSHRQNDPNDQNDQMRLLAYKKYIDSTFQWKHIRNINLLQNHDESLPEYKMNFCNKIINTFLDPFIVIKER